MKIIFILYMHRLQSKILQHDHNQEYQIMPHLCVQVQ